MNSLRQQYIQSCKDFNQQYLTNPLYNFRIYYVRNENGTPTAVFVSGRHDSENNFHYGFAAQHSTREKVFHKTIGLNIALRRALGLKPFGNLPDRLVDEFTEFQHRSEQRLAEKLCSSREN